MFFWTTSSTSSTATLTLSTTIKDYSACHAGNIQNAKVTFWTAPSTSGPFVPIPGAQNVPVGLINPSDPSTGTATAITQWNIGSGNVQQLYILVTVDGYYYRNTDSDAAPITVSKPGLANALIGDGYLDLPSSPASNGYLATAPLTGAGANDSLRWLSLETNVQYNKSGTNPQGGASVTFSSCNKTDGTLDAACDPVTGHNMHTYLIKSSSISELTLQGPGKMSFSAKDVVQDVTNPASVVSVDGGATLQIAVVASTSTSPAQVAITVQRKSGGTWLSSGWSGIQTLSKTLVKGDVQAF